MPKFRYFKHNPYYDPERIAPVKARPFRDRRELLTTLVKADRRFEDLPNFRAMLGGLSRVDKNKLNASQRLVKGQKTIGPKAALIAAALSQFKNSDFSDPQKRKAYRDLRRQQEMLRAAASKAGQKNVSVPGGDKRFYNPMGKDFASRVSGVAATFVGGPVGFAQVFRNPTSIIPCIQRQVRREVMFAKGKGGHGYRVKKRRTLLSGIPC